MVRKKLREKETIIKEREKVRGRGEKEREKFIFEGEKLETYE